MDIIQVATGGFTLALPPDITLSNNNIIYLDALTTGGAIGITLPSIAALNGQRYFWIMVRDADANAAANNITLTADGADTINTAATLVMSANGNAAQVYVVSDTEWKAIVSA